MMTSFLEKLVEAESAKQVGQCYGNAIAHYGFSNFIYVARFMLHVPSAVMRENVEVLSSAPKELVEGLMVDGVIPRSPWARWSQENAGDVATRTLLQRTDDRARDFKPGKAVALMQERGMLSGRLISLKDKVVRSHGAVFLNPHAGANHDDADRIWSESHRELTLLSWVMHLRMATIQRHEHSAPLTERQQQVLEWSSAGKTVGEIATIIGVTPATVEKHLRLARSAMGADSTAQAILKAHLTHQIFMRNPADTGLR